MVMYKSPMQLVAKLPWVTCDYDCRSDRYYFHVEYKGITCTDWLIHDDGHSLTCVTEFILKIRWDIRYYLDAIWC
jgi:hypothetical protein